MLHLNLNWLRTFEAVARCSGFTAASKEIGLTQTAVSLQIKALETKLGHDLFIRKAKSVELTEIAKAYLPSVRNSLEALNMSTNGLFGPDLKSTIVVRGSMAFILWLAPRLDEFHAFHPGIRVKLVTAIWTSTADRQNVDVEIVLAPDKHSYGRHEKLSDENIVPISGLGVPQSHSSPQSLMQHKPIQVLGHDDHWARYLAAYGMRYDARSASFMVDTTVAACELAATGLGTAIVIERFAHAAIAMGQRIRMVGEPVPLDQSHFLIEISSAPESRTDVSTFKDWLRNKFVEG